MTFKDKQFMRIEQWPYERIYIFSHRRSSLIVSTSATFTSHTLRSRSNEQSRKMQVSFANYMDALMLNIEPRGQ